MTREELAKLSKEELLDVIVTLLQKNAELEARVKELEARVAMNSQNSSKPPSSDGYRKPPNQRKPSGKSPGGQHGHKGHGPKLPHEPDVFEIHKPEECENCPNASECDKRQKVSETRYEIDIPTTPIVTEHQKMSVKCPLSKTVFTGRFPSHIGGRLQYGANLKALAVSLVTACTVSISRAQALLGDLFDISIGVGTISSMVSGCAAKVKSVVIDIKNEVSRSSVIHVDETGTRVDGKLVWVHVSSTGGLTYIDVCEKRGKEGIDAVGVLSDYSGTAVHDCWASYFKYDKVRHGLCNAHLLRELRAVLENTGQLWAWRLMDFLLALKRRKEEFVSRGLSCAPPEDLRVFLSDYDAIVSEALCLNPVVDPVSVGKGRGRRARGRVGALVDRLVLRGSEFLLFFWDFVVPFDNNQAERDVRMFKVKQKVSGCFRSMAGGRAFSAIMSFVGTVRKCGLSAFRAIRDVLLGKAFSLTSNVTE